MLPCLSLVLLEVMLIFGEPSILSKDAESEEAQEHANSSSLALS